MHHDYMIFKDVKQLVLVSDAMIIAEYTLPEHSFNAQGGILLFNLKQDRFTKEEAIQLFRTYLKSN